MKLLNPLVLFSCVLVPSVIAMGQAGHWQDLKIKNEVTDRSECGLAAVDGKLYLVGGDSGEPQPVESFDPKTLAWTKLALAPFVMHHFQAVAYNNKIYVLEAFSTGGFPNQVPMSNVYVYDTEKDTWQQGGEMPSDRRRAGAGAVEYKGKLYLIAGIQHGHSSGTTNMFDVYNPVTQ